MSPNDRISHNVHTNFGPRVGFAYKASDKTVVHGAFGIVYDNWAAVTQMVQNAEGSWPDIGNPDLPQVNVPSTASPTPTVTSQNPFGGTPGGGLSPAATPFTDNDWFFDPNYKNAYSEQWNFGVQQQLSNSLSLKVDYVGSGSHRTNIGGYYNTALTPGPGDPQTRAPYPYGIATLYDHGVGSSSYNALQVSLDKRYTSGLVVPGSLHLVRKLHGRRRLVQLGRSHRAGCVQPQSVQRLRWNERASGDRYQHYL